MGASVCVLTAKGMAAIASVALKGMDAQAIVEKIFRPGKTEARSGSDGMDQNMAHRVASAPRFCMGSILHGTIVDDDTMIDEVIVGCEGEDELVIHCHGNPLLVERIVKLCQAHGAALIGVEQYMAEKHRSPSQTMIEAEAGQAMQTCATLTGAKIIANQLTCGLLPTVQKWLADFEAISLQELWAQCHQVLRKTSRAKFFINRCKIVIVGPPNSGKSTLLNQLAGRDEVIVSETAGTTRDWVSITCHIGPLLANIYDTAGLDEMLSRQDEVDRAAQQTTLKLIHSADMNIFVYDATNEQQAQSLLFSLGSLKAVVVANKCDLLTPGQKENLYSKYVPLCAKTGDGLEKLTHTLLAALKVSDYNTKSPACFTDRQLAILRQILHTNDESTAKRLLQTLLSGENAV